MAMKRRSRAILRKTFSSLWVGGARLALCLPFCMDGRFFIQKKQPDFFAFEILARVLGFVFFSAIVELGMVFFW